MRHDLDHRYLSGSSDRQLDLFGSPRTPATRWAPTWEALPVEARSELTALMTQLILDHASSDVPLLTGGAHHEP